MLFKMFSSSRMSSIDFDLFRISSMLGVFMKDDQNLIYKGTRKARALLIYKI